MLLRKALVSDRVIEDDFLLVLCCGVTIHVHLCACVLLQFLRKVDKTKFIANRSVYSRCIMAL